MSLTKLLPLKITQPVVISKLLDSNYIISTLQPKHVEFILALSFPHTPRAICEEILLVLTSKYTQNLIFLNTSIVATH